MWFFQEAIEIEPDYAVAHAWLSAAYAMDSDRQLDSRSEATTAKIMKHARRAVEIEPNRALNHLDLGIHYYLHASATGDAEARARLAKNARQELAELVPAAVRQMRESDPALKNSVFWITGSTSVFREIETINLHSDIVPVLSVVPDVVREGSDSAVLSIGVSFESNAHIAAIYGVDILQNGTAAGSLPVGLVSPPDIAVNFLRAREIGLKVPFSFFETASIVYDRGGQIVRDKGKRVELLTKPGREAAPRTNPARDGGKKAAADMDPLDCHSASA